MSLSRRGSRRVLALGFLAVFSGVPDGLPILYRLLAFIGPPAIILASLGASEGAGRHPQERMLKVAGSGGHPGDIGPVRLPDLRGVDPEGEPVGRAVGIPAVRPDGAQWMSTNSPPGNFTIAGDIRMQYLLTDYLGINVDTSSGYHYLESPGRRRQARVPCHVQPDGEERIRHVPLRRAAPRQLDRGADAELAGLLRQREHRPLVK